MPIHKKIGERIRQKRTELLRIQEDIAEEIGMSQSAYAKLENGSTKIDMERFVKISKVLGVAIIELLPKSLLTNSKKENPWIEASQEEITIEKQLHDWKDARIRQLEAELQRLKGQ